MFWKTKKKSAGTRPAPRRAASAILIEAIEPRTLMSASTVMSQAEMQHRLTAGHHQVGSYAGKKK